MTFYNMLFGRNPKSALLLAVIGLKEVDVERFRDVYVSSDGATIDVYARTGGGNRDDYPQAKLIASPLYAGDVDDDFDSTYATFSFKVPSEFHDDVRMLDDVLTHGLRREFAQHIAKTLQREPTDADREREAYEKEQAQLGRLSHSMANGHTFVPRDDAAMEGALKIAEENGGKLRSCWGILPLTITVRRDFKPYPNAKDKDFAANMTRIDVGYDWKIDQGYWSHCEDRFAARYPNTMALIREAVQQHEARHAR